MITNIKGTSRRNYERTYIKENTFIPFMNLINLLHLRTSFFSTVLISSDFLRRSSIFLNIVGEKNNENKSIRFKICFS